VANNDDDDDDDDDNDGFSRNIFGKKLKTPMVLVPRYDSTIVGQMLSSYASFNLGMVVEEHLASFVFLLLLLFLFGQ